jgi:hypothetical protein
MNPDILKDLKEEFDWQTIVEFGSALDDLSDSQWRFIKGLVAELTVEEHGEESLIYVGEKHKDYNWPKHSVSVELKSQLSGGMYGKKGSLLKNYTIKLNNSNGTNKKDSLSEDQVADVLIVVRNDGVFALDKATIMQHAYKGGDGFEVRISKDHIVELSGRITPKTTYQPQLKQVITEAIRTAIPKRKNDDL